ncbi:uncharacterized protein KY384_000048 [Bacidia gigantensis]|uniref:uncharacterized protein n=1 Tax=Bacidia gigantensis TaxID=2732470 RepID=UPI001D05999E|nr:uncharacterized protein KY384_000048 [Bacidia gigantensis]KAG8526455.1 hypothetical protein KY384_000048 [Bacidia gigantensis]
MAGTVIITAANSSLAIPAIERLLHDFPDHTLVLTVRNSSENDINTKKLRQVLAAYPKSKATIHQLDLTRLSAVHEFASSILDDITIGKLHRLVSIVCTAYHWNLVDKIEKTGDGFEKTLQVSHLAHAALVLRLLGAFQESGGRILFFSTDAHWPGKNGMEKYPPKIPVDLDLLVHPSPDEPLDNLGHGFQRYGTSKLVNLAWLYALNRHLEANPSMSNITAIAVNPGTLTDSRALRVNTPAMLIWMSRLILRPFGPLLRYLNPTMRSSAEAGREAVEFALNEASPGARGYFTMLKKDTSSPESQDVKKQDDVWAKTLEWVGISVESLPLKMNLS